MMYKIISYNDNSVTNSDSSYSLNEAIQIVKELRSKNINAELFPEAYANPVISETEALKIALTEYDKAKSQKPHNYGELTTGIHTPVYYSFYCRDFEKVEDGMSPGRLSFKIDKLSGKILTSTEAREYSKLNYSF